MKLFVFPGNLDPETRALGAQEVPYARTADFSELVHRCHQSLASLAQSSDAQVLSFTSSGTGAAEAVLAGWGPRWQRLLVLHAGTFGRRWLDLARHLHLPADDLAWPDHDEPPWSAIESSLTRGRYDAVVAVHHETSTGERVDLARLGRLCHTTSTRLIVDAIGSFLADEFAMEAWHVDAAFISSQKGLCLPPGLAILITRPGLGPPAEHSTSFYFNPHPHIHSFQRGQPLWSPAAQLYAQLDNRLVRLTDNGGVSAACATVATKARAFREAVTAHGWPPAARHPSNCLTALRFHAPATRLVQELATEGFFVLPSPDSTLIRVAHLGHATVDDHHALAGRIDHHARCLGLSAAPPPPL